MEQFIHFHGILINDFQISVHLPIPKSPAADLFRNQVYVCVIGDFGRPVYRTFPSVYLYMRHEVGIRPNGQLHRYGRDCNGLLADMQTFAPQNPCYLGRGAALFEYHLFPTPLQFRSLWGCSPSRVCARYTTPVPIATRMVRPTSPSLAHL